MQKQICMVVNCMVNFMRRQKEEVKVLSVYWETGVRVLVTQRWIIKNHNLSNKLRDICSINGLISNYLQRKSTCQENQNKIKKNMIKGHFYKLFFPSYTLFSFVNTIWHIFFSQFLTFSLFSQLFETVNRTIWGRFRKVRNGDY